MRKKILSLIVTIGLVATISMPVLANPLSDKLSNQNDAYSKAQTNIDNMEISIEQLDSDIEKMYAEVNKANIKIGGTEKEIGKTTKGIQVAEKNIKIEEDLFNKRMRSIYMSGVGSYVEVLLNSKGIEDFISRTENIKRIMEYDKKMISELKTKKNIIQKQKIMLETQKSKLVSLKSDNQNKLNKLKENKQAQDVLILKAKNEEQSYAGKVNDGQAVVAATMKQIQKVRENAPKYTASRGLSAPANSNSIVSYASNFLGTPYVWGAAGPKYFDCSGFMQYVYAHFGVSLSRTTFTQINEGSYVPRDQLQAGDLIFFGTQSNPHHVGMYVGNNSYIHAPRTGDVIKISALTRGDYLTARRVK
ncbi:C40 family peptidase [Clostridium psychrophilum]|uniref:C40 family peptidase n=1 Tax=Clostridium psychrophilum TaxID=132926 RepID=UPI001C0B03AE|nr:C40 family peptidase [Clostridium psychrophilum]MBU3182008.1 C40 family peptidase [Clostridium psychrophilum]